MRPEGMEEIYPEDAEPPEVTSCQTTRQRPDMGLGCFNYKNLLNLFRRKLPTVSQNLRDFDLLSQSLTPLSSFACKDKLARFCDPAVNISYGTGSKSNP